MSQIKIALCGRMRSGKDTFASLLKEEFQFEEFKMSHGITEIIQKYYPEKFELGKLREHYQTIGQTFRQLDPQVWIKYTDEAIQRFNKDFEGEDIPIVISDIRQDNEYAYAKDNGYLVIKVEASENVRIRRCIDANDVWHKEALSHETEVSVDNIPADIIITNNGTLEEFTQAIDKVMTLLFAADIMNKDVEDIVDSNFFDSDENIRIGYL